LAFGRIYSIIKEQKGRVDVLFANAGGGSLAPLGSITEEHFDQIFNTNVRGLLFTVQKALAIMPAGSSIVLNASITSIKGNPALSVYSASKAAVRSFARSWTLDLKDKGIRVNAISPVVVPTPGHNLLGLNDEQLQGFIQSQAAQIPLGRVGKTDEIAKAVVFLASEDSSFVNGIELFVDGGGAQI
jgi:NAD(P)-dependent dehydrogenase (short-subunit alcohol dehydrogenase family)